MIRFRPASKNDFSRYAKNLSKLLEMKLMKTQEMLARIYGFSSLHELQQELKKPGQPGPYDDSDETENMTLPDTIKLQPDVEGRQKRIFQLIADYKGISIKNLPSRYREAANISLFKRPSEHYCEFKRVRDVYGMNTNNDTSNVANN